MDGLCRRISKVTGVTVVFAGLTATAHAAHLAPPVTEDEHVTPVLLGAKVNSCADGLAALGLTDTVIGEVVAVNSTSGMHQNGDFKVDLLKAGGLLDFMDVSVVSQFLGTIGVEAVFINDANVRGGGGGGTVAHAYLRTSWHDDQGLTAPSGNIGDSVWCWYEGACDLPNDDLAASCLAHGFNPPPTMIPGTPDADESMDGILRSQEQDNIAGTAKYCGCGIFIEACDPLIVAGTALDREDGSCNPFGDVAGTDLTGSEAALQSNPWNGCLGGGCNVGFD